MIKFDSKLIARRLLGLSEPFEGEEESERITIEFPVGDTLPPDARFQAALMRIRDDMVNRIYEFEERQDTTKMN
jgi:hypothetical protein